MVECFNCHKLGHFQWECPTKEVNYTEAQEEMMLMAFVDVDIPIKMDTWFLDSGCSNHMCGKKDCFSEIDENFSDTVKLGDNRSVVVAGKEWDDHSDEVITEENEDGSAPDIDVRELTVPIHLLKKVLLAQLKKGIEGSQYG
ncbi:hypothetical protein Salat_0219500 [Sesamum alatum]|uniref:CCHC-type domain-containing protein n=1 Tax=Sesamum alatum TaxID=300844 RepID=A0AAE1YYW5_9LAMI|nr:hypothetical protein Salat_0219500 [Sesamum alatum]